MDLCRLNTFVQMQSAKKYKHHLYSIILCMSIAVFFSLDGKAQVKPIVKDSLHIVTKHFSRVSFKDSIKTRPAYTYIYKAPSNELMFWSNYPLTSAQIEQRQKVEEHRKVLPAIGESIVESYLNNKKKKRTAVVPAF
jgi:hypothetical protein